jgi:hypothetical protein
MTNQKWNMENEITAKFLPDGLLHMPREHDFGKQRGVPSGLALEEALRCPIFNGELSKSED